MGTCERAAVMTPQEALAVPTVTWTMTACGRPVASQTPWAMPTATDSWGATIGRGARLPSASRRAKASTSVAKSVPALAKKKSTPRSSSSSRYAWATLSTLIVFMIPFLVSQSRSESQRDLPALPQRALGGQTHHHALARLAAREQGAPGREGGHDGPRLRAQLHQLSRPSHRHGLGAAAAPALEPELEARVPGAVEGARPPRADRPGPAHHVQELMILEAGEGLRDHRVDPAGEAQDRGEAVGQSGAAGAPIAER